MNKNYAIGRLHPRPSYLAPRISPSDETRKVLKLANEIKLIEKQTQFIKDNGISASELRSFNQKKLDIL